MDGSPPERDVLLATKLQVPRSRPGLVPRRRLADQLEEGLNRGLAGGRPGGLRQVGPCCRSGSGA